MGRSRDPHRSTRRRRLVAARATPAEHAAFAEPARAAFAEPACTAFAHAAAAEPACTARSMIGSAALAAETGARRSGGRGVAVGVEVIATKPTRAAATEGACTSTGAYQRAGRLRLWVEAAADECEGDSQRDDNGVRAFQAPPWPLLTALLMAPPCPTLTLLFIAPP